MIMLKDKSQECASNGKWKDKCDVVCVFDALVWYSQVFGTEVVPKSRF